MLNIMFKTTKQNDKIFNLLFEAAEAAEPIQGSKHASAILYKKQVLAVGTNSLKSHPLQKKFGGENKICQHSEISAIVQVINLHGVETLKRCSIWNLRLTKGGKVGNSRPCAGCQKAIEAFGIKAVYYT